MVPCAASKVPDFSNLTGPTKLGLVSEGDGPKYVSGTVAPTEGGAGNKLHPGPGPIGPGPGPCAELNVPELDDSSEEEPPEAACAGEFERVATEVAWTGAPPFDGTVPRGRNTPPPTPFGERLEAGA